MDRIEHPFDGPGPGHGNGAHRACPGPQHEPPQGLLQGYQRVPEEGVARRCKPDEDTGGRRKDVVRNIQGSDEELPPPQNDQDKGEGQGILPDGEPHRIPEAHRSKRTIWVLMEPAWL